MKQISNKEYEKYQQYQTDKLRVIVVGRGQPTVYVKDLT
jgi:hypothetical protein